MEEANSTQTMDRTDLRARIMTLRGTPAPDWTQTERLFYKLGHLEARLAAAHLASVCGSLSPAAGEDCWLSWGGKNVRGDAQSIEAVRVALHQAGTVPELKDMLAEARAASPSHLPVIEKAVEALSACIEGINTLDRIATQWEPDHSSGKDRRDWYMARQARIDARLMLELLRSYLSNLQNGSSNV